MRSTSKYLTTLRLILTDRFSEEELRSLCFDIGVDYDGLPGEGKEAQARELVAYMFRRKQLSKLVETGKALRPDINWEPVPKNIYSLPQLLTSGNLTLISPLTWLYLSIALVSIISTILITQVWAGRSTAEIQPVKRLQIAKTWPVVINEPFDTNDAGWPTGTNNFTYMQLTREITASKYIWTAESTAYAFAWAIPVADVPGDFYLTVQVRRVDEGTTRAAYGVTFRNESRNFYTLRIDDERYYALHYVRGNSEESLIDLIRSAAIQSDGYNQLTVVVEQSHYYFYINDQYIGDYKDLNSGRIQRGNAGLIITLLHPNDTGIFEFDNFEIRRKP